MKLNCFYSRDFNIQIWSILKSRILIIILNFIFFAAYPFLIIDYSISFAKLIIEFFINSIISYLLKKLSILPSVFSKLEWCHNSTLDLSFFFIVSTK